MPKTDLGADRLVLGIVFSRAGRAAPESDLGFRCAASLVQITFARSQPTPWPRTPEQVGERAEQLFAQWGEDDGSGLERLRRTLLAISLISSSFGTDNIEQDNPIIDVPEPGERFRDPEFQYIEEAEQAR